ncbi:MarR family transcriptional regulator [Natronomonas sp. F2-12]|uniref:MarR family transcriptional regulator n=2 Tax=Natronomonas aquatica TaxID=2841590 RepID=A0A9R1CR68_9EURY|nr:MarR family transcriptional regulator [Natronomonas aquatica]
MRPRVPWMTSADNHILEFLDEKNIVATPQVIAANIDYNRLYVNERIRVLAQNKLVEKDDKPLYQITERGRQYLEGELDVDDLPARHEEDR